MTRAFPRRSREPSLRVAGVALTSGLSALLVSGCFLQDDFFIQEQATDPGVVSEGPPVAGTAGTPDTEPTKVSPVDSAFAEETDNRPILGAETTQPSLPDAAAPSASVTVQDPDATDEPTLEESSPSSELSVAGDSGVELTEPSSAGEVDAGTTLSPKPCAIFSAWGEPEPILGLDLATSELSGPSLSSDGLDLYFAAASQYDERIYTAHRDDRMLEFTAAKEVTALTSTGRDASPAISADDLSLVFSSTRVTGQADLWLATRSTRQGAFANPVALDELNTTAIERASWLSADGLSLLYVTEVTRAGGGFGYGSSDIWLATRATREDVFLEGVPFSALNSDASDEHAAYSSQGLAVYFASDRETWGDLDLLFATRKDVELEFGEPASLSSQNTDSSETEPTLSRDSLELVYASDRDGSMSLWHALRECAD